MVSKNIVWRRLLNCNISDLVITSLFWTSRENDSIVEKASLTGDLASKLSKAHDLLVKLAKIAAIVGAVCGFIYLLSYTSNAGIPFPLELTVLPTTLLIVGLTSVIGTFIVIAGMFVPAFILDYNDEVTKGYRRADDRDADVGKTRLRRYVFCTWMPTALALIGVILLVGVLGNASWLKLVGGALVFVSACWIFYTPKYAEVFEESRWQYFLLNSLQIALSVFAYSLIIIISIAVFPGFGKWPAWFGCIVALAIFTLCQAAIFVPPANSTSRKILLPPNFKHETTPAMGAAFIFAAACAALSLLMPQANYKIGGAALRAFRVGGDLPIAICLKTKPGAEISKRFSFDVDHCSEKLSLKLDSGDRVYVSKYIDLNTKAQTNQSSQIEAIYFRQDEIKQKIYFR